MANIAKDENLLAIQVPTGRRISPEASFSVSTAVSKTVEEEELIEIIAKNNGVYVKYTTATDTDDCTSSNFDIEVLSGTKEYHQVPQGVTGISLLAVSGTSTVTLIRR